MRTSPLEEEESDDFGKDSGNDGPMRLQLTFVNPVWDSVENLIVLAVEGDLFHRYQGAGLDIYVIFPNVGLKK